MRFQNCQKLQVKGASRCSKGTNHATYMQNKNVYRPARGSSNGGLIESPRKKKLRSAQSRAYLAPAGAHQSRSKYHNTTIETNFYCENIIAYHALPRTIMEVEHGSKDHVPLQTGGSPLPCLLEGNSHPLHPVPVTPHTPRLPTVRKHVQHDRRPSRDKHMTST